MMETGSTSVASVPQQEEPSTHFLLALLKLQKLPEVVGHLYQYQSQLGFSSLYLALPREENKHLRVEKPKPGGKLFFHPNGSIEARIFAEEKRIIQENPEG